MDRANLPLPKMPKTDSSNVASRPPFWAKARRHLVQTDPVLAEIVKSCGRDQLVPRNDAFFSLARSIVGQQISVKAAQSIWSKLEDKLGGVTVKTIASANQEQLRGCGITRQKSGYLLDLATHFQKGTLDTKGWHKLGDEQVIKDLVRVKGIGRWTAEMFLIFHLLRPDVLPLGDIGIQRAMRLHFNHGEPMSDDEMVSTAAPWQPWRSVAVWYLWRSLDPEPVDY